jgi:hypothetical protein
MLNMLPLGSLASSWAVVLLLWPGGLQAEEPIRIRERFPEGYQYHVSTRVELAGALTVSPDKGHAPAKPLPVTGSSAIDYDERVLATDANGTVKKTARIYRRIDFRRRVGEQPQQSTIRPEVRRLVVLRHKQAEVPFSPDGPLTWGEIDLVRTDVFTPALIGLLPDRAVLPGDRWTATTAAIKELTDLERIEEGQIECRLEQMTVVEKRRYARISLAGTVRGVNEDGPNRQQLNGYFFFDLESDHLSYLSLQGVHSLLDKDGKTVGRMEGRFVMTRQARQQAPDLADEAWKGVALEPNAENTLLLYDNPELGVRLNYPRRWHVAGVRGRQLALDEANGNGLLLTLDTSSRVPTAAQFRGEVQDWLVQQKGKILQADPPRRPVLATDPESFAFDVELAGQRVIMSYFVIHQAAGGATLAARLLPADRAGMQADLERIVRSLTISEPARSKNEQGATPKEK